MPSISQIISRAYIGLAAATLALAAVPSAQAQPANTSFFVTSVGIGNGGNLGGLAGADNYCQTLAQAAGAGARTFHAYLSTQGIDGKPAVNARARIGKGPWQNAKGVVIAKDVAELHGASNNLTKQTALSEKGDVINGRGDTPNRHDVLTGSQPDGTAFAAGEDRTCRNWTSSTSAASRRTSGEAPVSCCRHFELKVPPPSVPARGVPLNRWSSSSTFSFDHVVMRSG